MIDVFVIGMESRNHFIAYSDPDGREKVYHLIDTLVVGRSSGCQIVIDEDGVSRRHCVFTLVKPDVVIRDLDSTNGTYLNGSRIREAVVRPGDRVVVGPCTLDLLLEGDVPSGAGSRTRLLGRTTIETLLEADAEKLPDSVSLTDAGLGGDCLRALFQLTDVVNRVTDLEELMLESLSITMKTFQMDLGCIYHGYESKQPLEPVLTQNLSGLDRYLPSVSVVKKAVKTNVSIIATDLVDNADSEAVFKSRSIAESGTATIMCVPLRTAGAVTGAVYLSSLHSRGRFSEAVLQLFVAMSTQIGLAMESLSNMERLKRENLALRSAISSHGSLVGPSKAMDKIRAFIDKVAASDATVLITGESGTGKELIANAVHSGSKRAHRPMVSINCGAIPESMVENELFGHEKGAFTGAVERKVGKFELATEGTIFLDEIGDLHLGTQVKLLRALENKRFFRLGGEEQVKVDIRIITATNSDLEKKVKEGEFRSDLFYRLNVFVIWIPPLRDRPEDIPALAECFLDQLSDNNPLCVSDDGMARLMSYSWPGNARELRNVLEREVLLADGPKLHMKSLDHGAGPGPIDTVGSRCALKDAEKAHLIRVLRSVGWNKKLASEILGISRPTVYDKIKQHGIEEDK